jgi:asparagine synthase (glutamine-hydrolysing)
MLAGIERLVDLVGPRGSALAPGDDPATVTAAVAERDLSRLAATEGHFAAAARSGQTVRLARTLGLPLRYFVAKLYHGPFLVVADRIDRIYHWCRDQRIGWQFDPLYTRMVPAHHLVELDQIGCPDPSPRYHRFFTPPVGEGPADPAALGAAYLQAALAATRAWLRTLPEAAPVAVAFSGGVDSGATFLLARHAQRQLGRNPDLVRAFTLDLGGGEDAAQAEQWVRELGLEAHWERISLPGAQPDFAAAIAVIEDYHPLDVECAATSILLLGALRERYPELRALLDGDGGDENWKSYPLEDSDLTLSSVLRNPLLYHEGWGVDALKHSLTYSGGLSRAYARTFAPAQHLGFTAFSPFTCRPAIAAALSAPVEQLVNGSVERLYALKGDVVTAGVEAVLGIRMPRYAKRRFQHGAGGAGPEAPGAGPAGYRAWRVSKAWCRRVFLRQWEERLAETWDSGTARRSGNELAAGRS